MFASEKYILEKMLEAAFVRKLFGEPTIRRVEPGSGYLVRCRDMSLLPFALGDGRFRDAGATPDAPRTAARPIVDSSQEAGSPSGMRRCTRCILPETMPMIRFDGHGVCNFCRAHKKAEVKGLEALETLVAPYRSRDGSPDCIVSFSGGRDSSYALHFIKTVLKMNPVSYTYDWGMVTDLARRNQARICGKLGIEHVLISADIKAKRKNICRNVKAWLKKPDLGMVPLFMAGDKQYFYYADKLRRQMGIHLVFFGGNRMEKTNFKSAFTGVDEGQGRLYNISAMKKLKLIGYYLRQFLTNPTYLNRSLIDTAFAFYSSYIILHDFIWLYDYIPWDEKEIAETLRREYDWEMATDTDTSWRIGDGTAAFYNYIYHTVAGFTENDTFRSNQIREGMVSREEALKLVERDNKPRYESIVEYSHMVGFDCDEAMARINAMPKLYSPGRRPGAAGPDRRREA
jgi:hypothetical protein